MNETILSQVLSEHEGETVAAKWLDSGQKTVNYCLMAALSRNIWWTGGNLRFWMVNLSVLYPGWVIYIHHDLHHRQNITSETRSLSSTLLEE